MNYDKKKDALYIRGVVLAKGLSDDQDDKPLTKKEIKKIFTSYANRNTQDIMHDFTKIKGVSIISNEIIKTDEEIGGQLAPSGPWICDSIIFDPRIKKLIQENKITGYSLGAIQEEQITKKEDGQLYFKDLKSMECLNPLFISLVDKASNGFRLEVYDYKNYLSKGANNMKEENFIDKFINKLVKASKDEKEEALEQDDNEERLKVEKTLPKENRIEIENLKTLK